MRKKKKKKKKQKKKETETGKDVENKEKEDKAEMFAKMKEINSKTMQELLLVEDDHCLPIHLCCITNNYAMLECIVDHNRFDARSPP